MVKSFSVSERKSQDDSIEHAQIIVILYNVLDISFLSILIMKRHRAKQGFSSGSFFESMIVD